MESQMIRSHDYNQAQEPRTVGDQQQEGGEKKSVLKKFKDKAKKIKETIKNRGHGHDHESDEMKTPPDDHDLDEEDSDSDSDEEILEDPAVHGPPEIHGAPMYESGAGRTDARTRQPEELSRRPGVADERAFLGGEGKGKSGDMGRTGEHLETPQNTPVQSSRRQKATFVPATVESPEQRKVHLEIPRGMEEDPAAPTANAVPTSNYQSKVTDPTGRGEEVRDLTPMIESFGKLGMREEQKRGEKESMNAGEPPLLTGSHDQFKPEPASEKSPSQGGYMSAISSTAASLGSNLMSRVVGSATATEIETTRPDTDNLQESGGVEPEPKQSSVVEAVKDKIGPVYEKAAGAGTAVLSKIVGPGNQETMEVDSGVKGDHANSGEGKGMPLGSYLSEKLKPGEEDEALSEMISEKLMMKREDGNGMVDKLRGAVGSWFSNPGQPPHPTQDSGTYNEAVEQKMGLGEEEKEKEKQLQESGN